MTLFCGRNETDFNTQSLESGIFCFRLFWFFVLPVRVLYSILLLLVGSLPCRNPKCATRKNVPAIYIHDMWVTRSRASSQACKCSCGKGEQKKKQPEGTLRFFATTFQMGQTRRVLSGVKNPELEITATRRQSEKTSFLTY